MFSVLQFLFLTHHFFFSLSEEYLEYAESILPEGMSASDVDWLEEYQPPDSFVIRRGLYKGPALKV